MEGRRPVSRSTANSAGLRARHAGYATGCDRITGQADLLRPGPVVPPGKGDPEAGSGFSSTGTRPAAWLVRLQLGICLIRGRDRAFLSWLAAVRSGWQDLGDLMF